MKRSILATTLAMCVSCAGGIAARDLVVPARAQNATSPTYEYRVVRTSNVEEKWHQETMTNFAREGWRLSNVVVVDRGDVLLYFERPRA